MAVVSLPDARGADESAIAARLIPPRFETGTRVVRLPMTHTRARRLAAAIADHACAAGLPVIRPGALDPSRAPPGVFDRHLLFVVADARDRRTFGRWLCAARGGDPPALVVFDLTPERRAACVSIQARWPDLRRGRALDDVLHGERRVTMAAAVGEVEGRCLPARLRGELAWLRFWQGRFEEMASVLQRSRSGPDRARLFGFLAWACGDLAALDRALSRLARDGSDEAVALRLLRAGLARDAGAVLRQTRRAGLFRDHASPLLRAAALEAARACGVKGPASQLAAAAQGRAACTLWPVLGARLRCARDHADDDGGGAWRVREGTTACRIGAAGIGRWGLGRSAMYLLHVLPALLQIVGEAEDEAAALTGVCGWARQHCLAEAVWVLSGDHGDVLARGGSRTDTLCEDERRRFAAATAPCSVVRADGVLASVPVRYGGARIGAVVIGGAPERRETIGEAAQAIAVVAASVIRARLTMVAIGRSGEGLAADILGQSPAIAGVRDAVARAAAAPFPVLIEGESGTGKELIARALHRLGPRRDRRLATLNCAALSDELVEAELFGHTRGAFTGAVAPRAGLFEDAHGGTLFLDEIGELSPRAQAKLLRALQDGEVRRVGENGARRVDVRVIAATNRPLADMTAAGGFRDDLLFRLAVIRLRVPPLRDRSEDIGLLAQVFWRRLSAEAGKRSVLAADAMARLVCHRWPGNVRELHNVVAALVVMAPARGRVGARHVDQVLADAGGRPLDAPISLAWARTQCERRTIAAALARHGGRRSAAARELGITRQGLTKAVRRLRVGGANPIEGVA